ncbi:MAG: serine/threonine protein kinase [Planctomycetaceae bacterium]|nr:serine/threonine protein kinase [Planctomycetaceae bacterium]
MATSHPKANKAGQELAETVVPGRAAGDPKAAAGSSDLAETDVVTPEPSKPKRAPAGEAPRPKASSGHDASTRTSRLGDFEIRKQLGQGGMGKVYLAHQVSLDRDCALKVMSGELAGRPGFVDRFIREARAMAKIDHPNVVRCYAVDEQDGKHFVAMELIDGQSMQDWLNERGVLSIEDALHVVLVCADALQHAHGLNMVHRDVKPDNILVTKNGVVKVSDLGLAKALDDDMSMTQSGTGLGTPHYMPPEQARDAKHVDPRCDVYALGCTLYHFVTGKLPFAGENLMELIRNKERGQFTPARRLNPRVPERLDLIIDKMMAREPRHRYASCREVIRDLEALNLAGDSLSFIKSNQKAVVRRGAVEQGKGPAGASTPRGASRKTPRERSAAETRQRDAATGDEGWYVRYPDASGKVRVSRMTTPQILQGLKSDLLDLRSQVSRSTDDDFRPIAQIAVFEVEAKRAVTRARSQKREANMANAFAKIERQYNRQKWWRILARFRDGTLGVVGLILYLLIVLVVIAGIGLAVMYGYQFLGSKLHL